MDSDVAIARDWPDKWARANSGHSQSKKRNNLRKQFRQHLAFQEFKRAHPDASCASCVNFERMPLRTEMHCAAESDFHGYAITTAEKVCMNWTPAHD